MRNGVMRREPAEIPRKPGVFTLMNRKDRCAYTAFTTDLQKRSHSLSHMLHHPKTHWSLAEMPVAPADVHTFVMVEATDNPRRADRLIEATKRSLATRRYRAVNGNRSPKPTVQFKGKAMRLTEAMRAAKCKSAYITVWRRLKRGWSLDQALDIDDPPPRWARDA